MNLRALLSDCDVAVEFRLDDDDPWRAGLICGEPVDVPGSVRRWARVAPADSEREILIPIRADRLRALGTMIGKPGGEK